jgi:hypothetical protein
MRLYIKTLTGRTITMWCYSYYLIEEMRDEFYSQEGVPPDQQRLIYDKKQLEDGMQGLYCVLNNDANTARPNSA